MGLGAEARELMLGGLESCVIKSGLPPQALCFGGAHGSRGAGDGFRDCPHGGRPWHPNRG